jgi:indolepyruvate ferredoxin oxidoreductase beta subunit
MKTINVSLVGVGGQGILLTADLLATAAVMSGLDVKKSEIHGMAQRGGSVISSVRFGMEVHSPIIPEGQSDILVAFDRLEALRWSHFLAKDGKVLMNSVDLVPVTVSSGLQQPVADFETRLAKTFPDALTIDAAAIAERDVGNARTMNMVIAGALSRLAPFKESVWKKALAARFTGRKAALLEINEKAFALGRAAVADVGME